jgi:uncharacterized protein
MSHLARNKKPFLTQVAILAACLGGGFILSQVVFSVVIGFTLGFDAFSKYTSTELIEKFVIPANVGIVRVNQFLLTFITFFLPAWIYAKICHTKTAIHFGFSNKVKISQVVIAILIMIAVTPVADALSKLTLSFPFSETTFEKFKAAEVEYAKQISVVGKMDSFPELLLSLFMLSILPALFEELFFRGALQNLLSRWWGKPILAVIVSSLLFSAVHFSYTLFLSRALLGFALGWMYYRTGNIWLSVIAHAVNNAFALIYLYVAKLNDQSIDISKTEPEFPLWAVPIAIAVVVGLFMLFERVSKYQINKPGEEVLIEYEDINKPSWTRQ